MDDATLAQAAFWFALFCDAERALRGPAPTASAPMLPGVPAEERAAPVALAAAYVKTLHKAPWPVDEGRKARV